MTEKIYLCIEDGETPMIILNYNKLSDEKKLLLKMKYGNDLQKYKIKTKKE